VVSAGVHKRSTLLAATALALLAAPPAALAAGPGGTAPAGATPPAATAPAAKAPPARAPLTTKAPARISLHVRNVRIASASCTPTARCGTNPRQVSQRGTLLLQGPGLRAGMIVVFPSTPNAHVSSRRSTPGARLHLTSAGLVVSVPGNAHSGRIMVLVGGGGYTSVYGPISIVNHGLHPPGPRPVVPSQVGAVGPSPLEGQGMWIWYISQSNGGNVASIVAQAHAAGVGTLFIKSSDGASNYWSQFSRQLVAELHANGIRACAWQYVYGTNPRGEALLGAQAAANGADCLVIDAEAEYEGRYGAAQTYIRELRAHVGPSYPIALASFPYVNYHSSEPYSVFLGPGGAQFNAPQMYWKAIGQSVDTVYANTWIGNRVYGRPIFPLGQTYEAVAYSDLVRFREEAVLYGASGWSFWDWQETNATGWRGLTAPLAPLSTVAPNGEYPELHKGSKGDQVLWLQEHLASAVPAQETTGNFGSQTLANLSAFQAAHGIEASGVATPATWHALLALQPVEVNWTAGGPAA
jgi:peptidoglycan hydrolase-like protein with peptidoglycan-binding domain